MDIARCASCGQLLRARDQGTQSKAALCDRNEGRRTVRPRRDLGELEAAIIRRMAPYLRDRPQSFARCCASLVRGFTQDARTAFPVPVSSMLEATYCWRNAAAASVR